MADSVNETGAHLRDQFEVECMCLRGQLIIAKHALQQIVANEPGAEWHVNMAKRALREMENIANGDKRRDRH